MRISRFLKPWVFMTLACILLSAGALWAQISTGGTPYSFSHPELSNKPLPSVQMPGIDRAKLDAEDEQDERNGIAPRFGYPHEVNLNLENSGHWETLPNGGRIWRLGIQAPGALSINLLYNDFYLPDGAELYIYSADRKHVIGGFTSANNKSDRIFATGLVYSDHIVLEYYEPEETPEKKLERRANNASISINYVVHGYRYIELKKDELEKAFDDSGNCNVNTVCAQGDNWRDQIKSVAMILVGGFRNCTGFLVNNTAQDCRPLFLTANHCLGSGDAINSPNLNTWTFMWRYESPNCTPDTDGPTNMTTSGATLLANSASGGNITGSDFAVLLLAESPKTAGYDVYFAGFDATTTAPGSATGIHHPSGDVKKISMENAALTGTSYGSTSGTATHWRVADWDSGTTEPGSSGSPIFSDATKRAMGFLSGGGAACGNNLPDWYGSLGYSWNNNNATDSRRRLRDHLDPGGLATFVDGSADPCASPCSTTALFSGTLTTEDPTYNRVVSVGPPCSLSGVGTAVHYDAHSFTLSTAATVTVSIDPADGASISPLLADTYLSLYGPGGFNQANPCANILAVNDDIAGSSNRRSRIVTGTLPAGTYTAVFTSFDNVPGTLGEPLPWTYSLVVLSSGLCEPTCPTFSGAPANVSITNSSCGSGCTLTGGSITAPTGTPCPAGATLEYNVNNTGWTTTLPVYDQDGPAQTIRTRCACDNDGNNVSAESNPVSTIPGTLPNPVVPANGASTVACPALATQPTPPTVTACDGSVITPTAPTVTNNPNPLTCEGTRTYTWTYNCGSTSATWSYVYTIERQPFTVPANGAATVNNPALATAPTPPTVLSNCGETLTPSAPAITDSPNPVVCTGTRTYAYTYTDCEGNTAVWSFVYTVIDNTPPTPTAGAIAACYPSVAAAEAAALAATTATDNCPGMLTETASTAGTCSAVVTVTTTDAAGNPASVMYNTRIDNTPPTLVCRTATVVLNNAGGYTLTAADVFNIGASSDNCPGALTVTNISPTSVNCNQVGQTVPVVVTVQDGCGNTATCTAQITVQEGTALPAGWSNANVGAANGTAGYKVCSGQQFTVTASGFSTLNADVMHVAYQQLCGNGSITARVTNVTGGGWGGVILRESLSPGAKKAVLKTQLNSIIRRELRTTTNGVTSALNFNRPQHEWLRLTRSGSIIEGYTSTDGVSWTFAFSANISMSSCVQVGLFSESINVNTATTATFTNVVLSGGSPALAEGTTDGFYGMDQALSDIDVTVAPNPTRGLVNLQFQAAPAAPVTIEVFNLLGERVNRMANQDVAGASLQVDLQGRPAGVYYLHISAAGVAPVVKRIVVTGE